MATETEEPIDSVSISMTNSVDHSPDGRLFFIGGFYVKPEYRGRTIGKRIFEVAVNMADGANLALNGDGDCSSMQNCFVESSRTL